MGGSDEAVRVEAVRVEVGEQGFQRWMRREEGLEGWVCGERVEWLWLWRGGVWCCLCL